MKNFKLVEKAIEDIKNGKIVIVTDDKDRENEGDLICAAQFATHENINFMAKYAKGLICTPLTSCVAKSLGLDLMVHNNEDPHGTAYTLSVDHIETTTGISSFERSKTAISLASKHSKKEDFRKPGHMFPLIAKEHGVLQRPGHTEATVDLCKLAGLEPVGICVEIIDEDGTMMKLEALGNFALKHNLTMITIKDLIQYRKLTENLLEKTSISKMPTKYGDFMAHTFVSKVTNEHHIALVKGDVKENSVLCRIHSECLTGDAFGSLRCDCGPQLEIAMHQIEKEGSGILLYMRQEGRGIGLVNKLRAYELQDTHGMDTVEANEHLGLLPDAREYYLAAQMLKQLGVNSIRLLTNNPAKMEGLEGIISIEERVPIEAEINENHLDYLKIKKSKMGHILENI